jgi:hypothetical protein
MWSLKFNKKINEILYERDIHSYFINHLVLLICIIARVIVDVRIRVTNINPSESSVCRVVCGGNESPSVMDIFIDLILAALISQFTLIFFVLRVYRV